MTTFFENRKAACFGYVIVYLLAADFVVVSEQLGERRWNSTPTPLFNPSGPESGDP
jgi:hypothetical protein